MDTDKQSSQADEPQGTRCVPFDEFIANAAAIFDEVASGKRITVERNGMRFRLTAVRRRSGRQKRFSLDDPLFGIIGIARSEGPTDVSSNKHKYIADAIAAHFEQPRQNDQEAPHAQTGGAESDASQTPPTSSSPS